MTVKVNRKAASLNEERKTLFDSVILQLMAKRGHFYGTILHPIYFPTLDKQSALVQFLFFVCVGGNAIQWMAKKRTLANWIHIISDLINGFAFQTLPGIDSRHFRLWEALLFSNDMRCLASGTKPISKASHHPQIYVPLNITSWLGVVGTVIDLLLEGK